ncbi:hypothetical protein AALA22_13930 [Anaerovoracaceae bacterium 41-7]|uniref:NEAT domain-containing protein n=1 Tax=Anaerotruncus colihominis TaxID=169435 RepID=A0A845QGG3_9FIRM|nr:MULTISPECIES: hypothetical protein [Anaerotruncus]MCI9639862.1 hypothetical protein [Emergencia sp.]NBH60909.1 hypothetical protein [Anaerotruncus colihominis]NCF01564.1 hypothetical protein [Anaerotruncus sp. 80]
MSVLLILTSSLTAFANSSVAKKATIKLDISTSKEDKEIIKQYKKIGDDTYSKENNNIIMNVTDIQESEDKVLVSGDAVAKMFGESYNFSFKEKELDIKYVKNKKFYTGAFEVVIDDKYNGIIDITAMATFSKTIISFTLLDLEDEDNQSVMLYGNTFKEQVELFNQELEAAEKEAVQEPEVESKKFAMAASTSAYQHVANKSNSSLGGVARDKQMVVISVSKCDPKNFGSGTTGFEMIRVFSRSHNATEMKYESPILLAKPSRVKVTFKGDPDNLMSVNSTKPTSGNGALTSVFKVFNSVVGSQGSGLIAAISAIIDHLSISVGDTISKSGTNATFDIGISNLNASSIDLPRATTSSNAKDDTKHGIPFKVCYTQDVEDKTANISVSAVLTYQLFLNTNRTVSLKTGAATISHTVNLN